MMGASRFISKFCLISRESKLKWGYHRGMATIHISEEEAIRDFAGLLAHAHQGAEILIEKEDAPTILLREAALPRRSISESIALAEAHSKELGYAPVMTAEFAADLEDIIANRKPRDTSAWD
jgi:hypothetical protein